MQDSIESGHAAKSGICQPGSGGGHATVAGNAHGPGRRRARTRPLGEEVDGGRGGLGGWFAQAVAHAMPAQGRVQLGTRGPGHLGQGIAGQRVAVEQVLRRFGIKAGGRVVEPKQQMAGSQGQLWSLDTPEVRGEKMGADVSPLSKQLLGPGSSWAQSRTMRPGPRRSRQHKTTETMQASQWPPVGWFGAKTPGRHHPAAREP